MTRSQRVGAVVVCLALLVLGGWGFLRSRRAASESSSGALVVEDGGSRSRSSAPVVTADDGAATLLYAHNLRLRQGPDFRVYVRWIRGEMVRTNPRVPASFDDPESFILEIQRGVVHVNIGDMGDYLNKVAARDSPLREITMQPDGEGHLKLRGTLHKLLPLPIEMLGDLEPAPNNRVRFHVIKLSVLKMPMKGLLGTFHIQLSDLIHATNTPGVDLSENDIVFDSQRFLPAPHILGPITSMRVYVPDVEVIYGDAKNDEQRLAEWHNFLKLTGGTIHFGKLTMHDTDLTMIDASDDAWFDLDLVNYQRQLVHGLSRITPTNGLEVFMPSVQEQAKTGGDSITLDWLRNRNAALPPDVPLKR